MCGSRNYRAYDKKGKLMQGIYDIVFCVGGVRVSGTGVYMGNGWAERTDPTKRCDVILMQSTGVKDSVGVEIYEGDIVAQEINCMYEAGKEAKEVRFADDQFLSGDCSLHCAVKHFDAVVVGNIHENPELLEAELGDRREALAVSNKLKPLANIGKALFAQDISIPDRDNSFRGGRRGKGGKVKYIRS